MTDDQLPEGTVTILFTDVEGSTAIASRLGDDAARRLLRPAEEAVRRQIARHHGQEVKGLGDGVMAAFGSARRAVDCAIGIQRAVERIARVGSGAAVRLRVGLNTGEVIRERADLFGSAVNAAKRIEALADAGGILVSETTRALLGPAPGVDLIDRGEAELKGFDALWRLFEIRWRDERERSLASSEPTPFVGRAAERARLIEHVGRALQGEGSLVLLGGEAGIGKSRLAEEISSEARGRGMLTLTGHCQDVEGRQPYLPFVETLERAMQIVSPEALREALGPNAPEVAKLAPELRRRYPDIPAPIELPPEQERRHLLNGMREFLARASAVQPMLLVFEDLQWADEATLMLVRHVAQHLDETSMLVIGTYRDTDLDPSHPFAGALQDLVRRRLAQDIVLAPLGPGDVSAMLERRAGAPSPDGVLSLVCEETDGNPFFVEELFRHLQESGKLFADDGTWNPRIDLAPDEVPRSVRMLIGRRLGRLGEDCRHALTVASVVGRAFGFDVLLDIADLDDERLLDALEEAERAGIVREVSVGREIRYQFSHEQVRQTLLGELSSPRRQRLHRRIGETLERLHGGHVAQIAHHFYEAGTAADAEKTTTFLVSAAGQALAALAYEEALWYLDAARTTQTEERARVSLLRALALRGIGRIDDAFTAFDDALRFAPAGREHDDILWERAELCRSLFRGEDAVRDFELLLENARTAHDRDAELRALIGLGYAHYVVSLNDASAAPSARETLELAYRLARELGDKATMARALLRTRFFTDFWPEYRDAAKANAEEAVALATEVGDEGLLLDALGFRLFHIDGPAARAEFESVRARLESGRDPLRLKEHLFLGMRHYSSFAEFEKQVEACDRATALAADLGVAPVMYGEIKAEGLLDLGRCGEAWDALEQEVVAEPFGAALKRFGQAQYYAAVLAIDAATGAARDAAALGERFQRVWMTQVSFDLLARMLIDADAPQAQLDEIFARLGAIGRAEVEIATGRADASLERLSRLIARAAAQHLTRNLIVGTEIEVRALLALERWADAIASATHALDLAEPATFRPMIWRLRTSRARARTALGLDDDAAADVAHAARVIGEVAQSIHDEAHRRGFLAHPLVASVTGE